MNLETVSANAEHYFGIIMQLITDSEYTLFVVALGVIVIAMLFLRLVKAALAIAATATIFAIAFKFYS